MGQFARVESVDALKKFRAALCKFVEDVTVGLNEADAEIQRAEYWLKQEQQSYWKAELRKRTELHTRAKSDLARKKMQKTALGGRFSHVDEMKALAAAERRLEEAKQKQANVRRWMRQLDEESFSYKVVAQGMSQAVEVDVPVGLARLDNMIAALEAYATSTAPVLQESTAPGEALDEHGRPLEAASMARGTPPAPVGVDAYRALRVRTPSQEVRDRTPIAAGAVSWPVAAESGGDVRETLALVDFDPQAVADETKVLVARGEARGRRVYLERLEGLPAEDSGWFVGFADETEVTGYEAVRAADLVAELLELTDLLELPAGCLVVLDGMSVEALLDAQDAVLWLRAPQGL